MPIHLALAFVLALAALPARAAVDTCRTAPDTLADQRALATLRADIETNCPCATATKRGAWRKCAKQRVQAALDAVTLREECRKTALADVKGAVCGSTLEPCGLVRVGATESPASCKTKAPARCKDTNKLDATACSEETHCSDVVEWTAGTCDDPRDDGPFATGVRIVSMTRMTTGRYCQGGAGTCSVQPLGDGCVCGTDASCASGVCATEPRTLDTYIFYPAPAGSGPIDPPTNAVLNAPLDASGGPYPIVMFSHGSCGYPNQSTFLWPGVASRGYIVVAPPHPGNTIFEFPNCSSSQAQGASFVERPDDIIFALDTVLASSAGTAFLAGAFDADRIGMAGHSFGGLTTFRVASLDPRIKVAVPLAPAVVGSPPLPVPSLMMLGAIDSVVNNPAARTLWEQGATPRYKVEIEAAGHFAFSNGCFPTPDCNPPTTLTQPEAHAHARRWILPFLDLYLKGDQTAAPFFLPPPEPGVTFEAVPQ